MDGTYLFLMVQTGLGSTGRRDVEGARERRSPRADLRVTSVLLILVAILPGLVGCGGTYSPPSQESREESFVGCLATALSSCTGDPVYLRDCTPFDWDEVLVADPPVLRLANRWLTTRRPSLVGAIHGDWRLGSTYGDTMMIFFQSNVIVEVFTLPSQRLNASALNGIILTPSEAVFSGSCFQPVSPELGPFFRPTTEQCTEVLVAFIAGHLRGLRSPELLCIDDSLEFLFPEIERKLQSSGWVGTGHRLRTFSECRALGEDRAIIRAVPSAVVPEFLYVPQCPFFVSEGKALIHYRTYCSPVCGSGGQVMMVREGSAWRVSLPILDWVS